MAAELILQDKITISGTTANGTVTIIQALDQWADLLGYSNAVFTIKAFTVSKTGTDTVDIGLATMDQLRDDVTAGEPPNGPRWPVKGFTGIASDEYYKHNSTLQYASITATETPMDRFVGWVLTVNQVSGGPIFVTFEIRGTLGEPG